MYKNLLSKLKESFLSILPIALIVCFLSLTVITIDKTLFLKFLLCSVLLIFGMGLFNLGADMSMIKIGESIGAGLTKTKKLSLMLISAFFIGFVITFAEPDLTVLASQTPINKWIFISCVSLGVAIFLVLAVLKIVCNINLGILLSISYGLVFLLAFIFPNKFLALSFDSGSVTTGPISVPFIMAFGLGISSVMGGKHSKDDSFGLIALASAGPILSVMLLSIFIKGDPIIASSETPTILENLLKYSKEILIVILPIAVIFVFFQLTMIKLPKVAIIKITIGLVYTYIGIVIFLTGINSAYLPVASEIGKQIVQKGDNWILLPLSLILGYFIIAAEPAVQVLKKQVEEITDGAIKQKTILITMSIGVAMSVFVAMLKTLYGIPFVAIILPLYAISIGLSFYNSKILSAVAFDAGGTATGAMAVSFILPLISGVSTALGQDALTSAFGTIALIAIFPVLSLQILGFIHKRAEKHAHLHLHHHKATKTQVIDFDEEDWLWNKKKKYLLHLK